MLFRVVFVSSVVFLSFFGNIVSAGVYPWQAPPEETCSQNWSVEVNGKKVDVLTARTADPPFEKYKFGGPYAFVSIDADEPLAFRVREKSGRNVDSAVIRPLSSRIKVKREESGELQFKVDRPCCLSLEPDGRNSPLLIFVNKPEKNVPKKDDPNVIWFGPGVHKPEGGVVKVKSGQTLYLAPGAILSAAIRAEGEDIRICGRGLVDSNHLAWRQGPIGSVLSISNSKRIDIEGIMIRGASRWTVVPFNCEDVLIENIKICGGRVQNDDGINPCNSRRVTIQDCFIRSDDDCIAIKGLDAEKGDCEDITVERCVFWCDRARIVLLGHESRAAFMRRIIVRNCDVIHSQERNFVFEPGEKMRLEEVLFENIRIESGPTNSYTPDSRGQTKDGLPLAQHPHTLCVIRPVVNKYMKTQVPGNVHDITFRDIAVTGMPLYRELLVSGVNAEYATDLVVFENVTMYGRNVLADSKCVSVGDFAHRVRFIQVKPDAEGFRSIFDGKSTDGWHGDPGYIYRNGSIVLTKGTKKHFYADPLYSNFVLRLDYRFDAGGNSGIALRSPSTQKYQPAYIAMEIQVLDDLDPSHFKAKPYQHNGSIYAVKAARDGFLKGAQQWNSFEITVNDYDVVVRLNGTVITEANLEKLGFVRLVNQPGETLKRLVGHVGFTGHGDADIEYKNLRIKPLD